GGRDPAVGGERRVRGGRALRGEGAEVVVGHDVVPVDVLGGARVVGGVDLAAVGAVGRDGGGHQVAGAEPVAQRLHEVAEGGRAAVVAGLTTGVRALPVDVDAVEHVRPARVLHQAVAGLGERGRVLRGLAEAAGQGPAADREQHLDVRVLLLELAQLVEVAEQGAVVPGVGDAVQALRGAVEAVVVGVGIGQRALAVAHVGEGVVDVRELGGRAAGVDVLDVVVALVDAPVHEVAEELVPAPAASGGGPGGDGGAGGGAVAGGVAGADGVGVRGVGAQGGVGVAGAGDGGDEGGAAVDLVAGDADVVGGGVPCQGDAGAGDAGR